MFPLRPGTKEPFSKVDMDGQGWKEYATCDEATIRHWFESIPEMNYAVNPPREMFILDPDLDPKRDKDGKAVLAEMEAQQDPFDRIQGETFEVKSPRGGSHLYVKSSRPVGSNQGCVGPGIDIRGFDGYVVGPGSHLVADEKKGCVDGDYTVTNDTEFCDAPQWLLERIAGRAIERDEDADVPLFEYNTGDAVENVRSLIRQQTTWPTEGQHGDYNTLVFAMHCGDYNTSPETTFELLTEPYGEEQESWNDRCEPAWEDHDLKRKIRNAYSYRTTRPGVKGGLLSTMPDMIGVIAAEAVIAANKDRFGKLEAVTFPGGSLMRRSDIPEFVIPDWLPGYGVVQNIARRGVGKTINTLDIGLRIARGDMDWYGYPIARDWAVVYLCCEDDYGLQTHMRAWEIRNGRMPDDDRFIVMTLTPNLMEAEEIAILAEYLRLRLNGRRWVTVLDTWQRATSFACQSDEKEMQTAFANAEGLARSGNGPMIANVHPPKHNETTASGSGITENNTTAIWNMMMETDQVTRRLTCGRIKNAPCGAYQKFVFDEVPLGDLDQFGREKKGIVFQSSGNAIQEETPEAKSARNSAKAIYASIIAELMMDHTEAKAAGKVKGATNDFNLSDTTVRVQTHLRDTRKAQPWITRLNEQNDKGWTKASDSFRRHLGILFGDELPVVCINRPYTIHLGQGYKRAQKFFMEEYTAPSNTPVITEDARMQASMSPSGPLDTDDL